MISQRSAICIRSTYDTGLKGRTSCRPNPVTGARYRVMDKETTLDRIAAAWGASQIRFAAYVGQCR